MSEKINAYVEKTHICKENSGGGGKECLRTIKNYAHMTISWWSLCNSHMSVYMPPCPNGTG